MKKPPVGSIGWTDLTVKDAKTVRDFYAKVAGWRVEAFDMGGYDDYCMQAPATGKTVAGPRFPHLAAPCAARRSGSCTSP